MPWDAPGRLAVFCLPQDQALLTQLLRGLTGLYLVPEVRPEDNAEFSVLAASESLDTRFALHFTRDQLLLCRADKHGRFDRDQVALEAADLTRRSGKPTELQRACLGSAGGKGLRVLDAFAGWGLDGLSLAAAGARVTCVELQPALAALLCDACRRVPVKSGSISVVCNSAQAVLQEMAPATVDVVYLDPMFPVRKKGALPNKRLQRLAELCMDMEVDVTALLQLARNKAGSRVVLKRRRKDPVLGSPQRQVLGTAVRYDVYLPDC